MSTDWYFRFRSAIRPELTGLDLDAIVARAPGRLGEVEFPHYPRIGDHDARGPVMGPATSYDGERFQGYVGAAAVGDELFLAIWTRNLEDADDPSPEAAGDTGARRLDILLGFMGWATLGPPGEVVGCIASEHDGFAHAHPLVRCADGLVRLCETPERPCPGSEEAARDRRGDVMVPETLPLDLVRVRSRSWASLDCQTLRDRFATLDIVASEHATPRIGAPRRLVEGA